MDNNILDVLQQIDYHTVINIAYPIIVGYISSEFFNKYKLRKDYKQKNIKQVELPPELTQNYNQVDVSKFAEEKLKQALVNFSETLIRNFKQEDLTNFYNNINELKVKKVNFKFHNFILNRNIIGLYDSSKNHIEMTENDFDDIIYHELFHMASSIFKNGIEYVGFHQGQPKKLKTIGNGINEGYTEVLTNRYFRKKNYASSDAYQYSTQIALLLEQIVGKDKMESLYLNANLYGLIDELRKYSTEEEIMRFITDTDFLIDHVDVQKYQLFEKNMITNSLKNVNRFLILSYSEKLKQLNKNNEITHSDVENMLATYISSMNANVEIGKHNYQITTQSDLKEILQTAFKGAEISFSTK